MAQTNPLTLASSVVKIPKVGPLLANKLSSLGIETVKDLLYYFPFRYEDLTNVKQIIDLEVGEKVSLTATLWQISKFRTPSGKTLIKAKIVDNSGSIDVVWFNQSYLLTVLSVNQLVNFSGKVGLFGRQKTFINPSYELIKETQPNLIHTQGLVPIYSETRGVNKKWLRTKIFELLYKENLELHDILSNKILKSEALLTLPTAFKQIHFPKSLDEAIEARKRFAFEELLLLQLRNEESRKNQPTNLGRLIKTDQHDLQKYQKSLPFKLTSAQEEAIQEILKDLASTKPMNRLLQGEVGSGKTVVASFAIKACLDNKLQVAFMAPTEILAEQHYKTLKTFLGKDYQVGLVTGSTKKQQDSFQLVIGTQALLTRQLNFEQLGLVVIDEQQRFGVLQRSLLRSKSKIPHFLTMTATPIPRTLALTLFGELQISHLTELPSERLPVKTYLVPREKRQKAYSFVQQQLEKGGQVFVICPLIEPSESLATVKSATAEADRLQQEIFPKQRLGLLHGRLKAAEKSKILEDFQQKKFEVLVSTPVVEVGIDVRNATVMIIEAAERFGLASLHQLRGRVGRGEKQSFCLLFSESTNPKTLERLELLQKSNDGLALAEADLKLRGAGDIYGTLQHGHLELKMFNTANLELITKTKLVAQQLVKESLPESLEQALQKMENAISSD